MSGGYPVFTLKLCNSALPGRMKIVACAKIDIVPDGDGGFVVSVWTPGASANEQERFRVNNSVDAEFTIGYVENARGSTTQVIRPRGR